jgi:hypothetical protein
MWRQRKKQTKDKGGEEERERNGHRDERKGKAI